MMREVHRLKVSIWQSGQSLVELLIAIAIGVISITAGIAALVPVLNITKSSNEAQITGSIAKELLENVRAWSESDWNALRALPAGAPYHLTTTTSPFTPVSGVENLSVASGTYSRYFYREDVLRDSLGNIAPGCVSGCEVDPSTIKITVYSSSTVNIVRVISQYVARSKNTSYIQTDWSGGPGQEGPLVIANSRFKSESFVDYTSSTGSLYLILPSPSDAYFGRVVPYEPSHWAWNDLIGWMDFYQSPVLAVRVYSDRLEGYASSSAGDIALNCNSTPKGDICSGPAGSWRVNHDGNGNLSGWGWNDTYGWISFCGGYPGCTNAGGVNYRVTIDTDDGEFHGFAWNDIVGWISFNCKNHNSNCGFGPPPSADAYRVLTDWRPQAASGTLISTVYDTGVKGAQLNSIAWRGVRPPLTGVAFRLATSECPNGTNNPPDCNSGTWTYKDLTSSGSNTIEPDTFTALDYSHRGRYFRYEVTLFSNPTQTEGPRVDEVIINWSF